MLVSTHESAGASGARAEVHQGEDGYYIDYYDTNGFKLERKDYTNYGIFQVEQIAEKWVNNVRQLNG